MSCVPKQITQAALNKRVTAVEDDTKVADQVAALVGKNTLLASLLKGAIVTPKETEEVREKKKTLTTKMGFVPF